MTKFAVVKDHYKTVIDECINELEAAARLRAGLMDSESKQAEIQAQQRHVMTNVASKLRGL